MLFATFFVLLLYAVGGLRERRQPGGDFQNPSHAQKTFQPNGLAHNY
jgi:hypothetical protein